MDKNKEIEDLLKALINQIKVSDWEEDFSMEVLRRYTNDYKFVEEFLNEYK